MFSKNEGRFVEKILHSKLKTGMWPSVSMILEKIHFFLPRIPRIVIQLFRDNHAHNVRSGHQIPESDSEFIDMQITFKSLYNATNS